MSEPKTHGELVAAGLRDDCDMWGLIPDNYICVDCGMDTWPGHQTRSEVEQSMRPPAMEEMGPRHPTGSASALSARGSAG
jgi:hypothetical protein